MSTQPGKAFADYPDVITIQELCELLRISRQRAYELVHSGQIPSRRFGRVFRIRKSDIMVFFDQ